MAHPDQRAATNRQPRLNHVRRHMVHVVTSGDGRLHRGNQQKPRGKVYYKKSHHDGRRAGRSRSSMVVCLHYRSSRRRSSSAASHPHSARPEAVSVSFCFVNHVLCYDQNLCFIGVTTPPVCMIQSEPRAQNKHRTSSSFHHMPASASD